MSYCVIAIKDNFEFRSVFCRYEQSLESLLSKQYGSFSAAKNLVSYGDISSLESDEVRYYHRDWGFDWKYSRPVEFGSRQSLKDYARGAKVELLYVFENGQWQKECADNKAQLSKVA